MEETATSAADTAAGTTTNTAAASILTVTVAAVLSLGILVSMIITTIIIDGALRLLLGLIIIEEEEEAGPGPGPGRGRGPGVDRTAGGVPAAAAAAEAAEDEPKKDGRDIAAVDRTLPTGAVGGAVGPGPGLLTGLALALGHHGPDLGALTVDVVEVGAQVAVGPQVAVAVDQTVPTTAEAVVALAVAEPTTTGRRS